MLINVKEGSRTEIHQVLDFIMVECYHCSAPFLMTTSLNTNLRNNHNTFYCPMGHEQVYSGKSKAERLQEELAKEKNARALERDELANKFLDQLNRANKFEKQLKRVHKGVCPCCKRTFQNLQRHMQSKHPDQALKIA